MAGKHVLDDAAVQAVLEREHANAKGDSAKLAAARPQIDAAKAEGAGFGDISDLYPKDTYLAVEPDMGRFLYLSVCMTGAKRIVEFGSSYGISTLYLAAGAREMGGHVIGSEMQPAKVVRARANLEEAGLLGHVDLREGDALETLSDVESPVDLLFLDGWKDLYLPVLRMMEAKLRPGALVLADNIFTFSDDLKDYVDAVSAPGGTYRSMVVPFESGLGYSHYLGS
jgi:predicted O-methyltransferase YrrM